MIESLLQADFQMTSALTQARILPPIENLSVVIPTLNSGRHIDLILDFYRGVLKTPVIVFVDQKTDDQTARIAKLSGVEVVPLSNESTRVTEAVQTFSESCRTDWILRLDDDEVPTLAMMAFVRQAIREQTAPAYGFLRLSMRLIG